MSKKKIVVLKDHSAHCFTTNSKMFAKNDHPSPIFFAKKIGIIDQIKLKSEIMSLYT